MKKRLVICLLAVVLVLGLAVSASAEDTGEATPTTPTIKVETVAGTSGKNATNVIVPVTIENNPGVASFNMQLNYDKAKLSYVGKTAGLLNPTVNGENETGLPVGYMNSDGVNITGDGTLFSLEFKVADDVTTDVSIEISVTAFSDEDYTVTAADITPVNGSITVTHTHSDAPGEDAEKDWTVGKAATCTEAGYTYYTCTYCNQEAERHTLSALGHDYDKTGDNVEDDNDAEIVAATCTTDGSKTFTCQREGCGYQDVRTITATGHNLVLDEENTVKTTCETDGTIVKKCTNAGCNYSESSTENAYHHEGAVYVEAAASKKGDDGVFELGHIAYYYCAKCDTYFKIDPTGKTNAEIGEANIYGTGETGKAAVTIARIAGDANDDKKVDSSDALRILRYSIGTFTTNNNPNLANSDVNGDNKVDSSDALRILRYSIGTFTTNCELQ